MSLSSEREPERKVTGYTFFDDNLNAIWVSSVPQTDEEAREYMQKLFGETAAFIHARRPDGTVEAI